VRQLSLAVLGALLLTACGGSDSGGGSNAGGGDPGSARGELLHAPTLVRKVATSDLLSNLDDPVNQALLLQAGTPLCDVAVYKIEYATVGGQGEDTTASGALMAPTGSGAKCTGGRPVVLYAHGTSTDRKFDLTDLQDSENAEGLLLAAFFAAQGFVVVAPNYTGYDTSSLPYHPYLVADAQGADMIDALAAARSALPVDEAPDTDDGGKLFVTGYSQGGYVAMATQRALEAAGKTVTAAVPMSGPYALTTFVDAVFDGRVSGGATVLGTFLFTAYQHAYGDVYSEPGELFESPYAEGVDSLLPTDLTRSALYDQGKLPQRAFFSLEPPGPAYADVTPPTSPEKFAPLYARGFAAEGFLIRNDYRLQYLQDMEAHPDGFWPDTTDAKPPANPALPLRSALAANDLRDWTPRAPTLLCGGHDDPTVFWLNTQAMEAYWSTHPADAPVTVLDVDAAPSGNGDAYADLKRRFGLAKDLVASEAVAGGAGDGGWEAVLEAYHAGLVAPFCLEAAQEFFEAH
jgi:dienelactone hydrolase